MDIQHNVSARKRSVCGNANSDADGDTDGNADGDTDGNTNGYANGNSDSYTDGYSDGNADSYTDGYADGDTDSYSDSDTWRQCLYSNDDCYRGRLVPGRHRFVWSDERTWFGHGRSRQRGNGTAITNGDGCSDKRDCHHSAVCSGHDGSGGCYIYNSDAGNGG